MKSKKGILYDELSYEVLGCAYEAFKAVEVGYDEFMYHQIFHDFLLKKGLNARYKVSLHYASNQRFLEGAIASLRNVDQALGAAYHRTIYEAALRLELKRQQTFFDDEVCIHVKVGNIKFKPFEIDFWLVEKAFLLGVLAGKDKPRVYDLLRMRSYLKRLNLHHGLIAYWSTNNFQLYGIYER